MADPCDLEVGAVVAEEVGAVGGSAAEGEELWEEDAACEVVVAAGPALLGEAADALAFGGAGSDDDVVICPGRHEVTRWAGLGFQAASDRAFWTSPWTRAYYDQQQHQQQVMGECGRGGYGLNCMQKCDISFHSN